MSAEGKRIEHMKLVARIALGLIWLYEGIVPKLFFLRGDEIALVEQCGLCFGAPATVLHLLGVAQAAMGLWLIAGIAERAAVLFATVWMCILIALVARGNPGMLTEPYGALVKDVALLAAAYIVWISSDRPAGLSQ